jgi:hydrogenase small subunit
MSVEANADELGKAAVKTVGAGITAHAAMSALARARTRASGARGPETSAT